MKNFNEKLKAARNENGLSQQKVAEAIGVTRSAYSNYEQGTISSFTIMILNQSGDTVCKEFKFKQA